MAKLPKLSVQILAWIKDHILKRQLRTRLKPVLQEEAFQTFDLKRPFERVASVAQHFSL
jgi:hypothetical protein